ncbi:hypothetical protein CsSME_00037180 [Camellia sinensis var. sinensis]
MATVSALGAEKPIVIFSKSGCCFCHTIKILIHDRDEKPDTVPGQFRPSILSLYLKGLDTDLSFKCTSRPKVHTSQGHHHHIFFSKVDIYTRN